MTFPSFPAIVTDVHDGDTFKVTVDLGSARARSKDYGFHIYAEAGRLVLHADIRLLGCNAIELAQPGGAEARDNLLALMPLGSHVSLHTTSPDKYGARYDAAVTLPDGRDLTTVLADGGWVALWNGTGPKPVPAWPRQGGTP